MDAQELISQLREQASNPGYSHNDYADTMREAADMLAERAVSPADSVQSLHNDHQFQIVLDDYVNTSADHREEKASLDDAHQAYRKTIDYIDASRSAAHAEGRRSALEELHLQWLAEKERADRAERERELLAKAIADAALKAGVYNGEVDLTGPHLLMLANDLAEQAILAQPLQQEGGKDEQTLFEKWYRSKADSYPDAHAGWMARAALKQVGAEEIGTVILCEDYGRTIKWKGEMPRVGTKLYTTPQPSDNLQQASTAQAEPAKEAANATDAGHPLDDQDRGQLHRWARHIEALSGVFSDERSLMCRQVSILLSRITYRDAAPAQATPEGADLPPLPEPDFMSGDCTIGESAYTDDQMRDYARAAVAATTAAEPVYQVASLTAPDCWIDVHQERMEYLTKQGYPTRTLYRAAPPQQQEGEHK